MLDEFPPSGAWTSLRAHRFMAGYGLKAFLIAQSLNQIEKAYGSTTRSSTTAMSGSASRPMTSEPPNAFRTRLATATEMKATKNYAGHRLSPWLGHLDGLTLGDASGSY